MKLHDLKQIIHESRIPRAINKRHMHSGGIHESRFLLSNFHASRTNFREVKLGVYGKRQTAKIKLLPFDNREFKPDVYGRQQTVNITSVFLFFSCYKRQAF